MTDSVIWYPGGATWETQASDDSWTVICWGDDGEHKEYKRRPFALDEDTGRALLVQFANVHNEKELMKFLNKRGNMLSLEHHERCNRLTGNHKPHFLDDEFNPKRLLQSAATLRWLIAISDAIQTDSSLLEESCLLELVKSKSKYVFNDKFTFKPASHLKITDYQHFNGLRDLHGKSVPSEFFLPGKRSIRESTSSWKMGNPDYPKRLARLYLSNVINILVSQIRPTVNENFTPSFCVQTPWQAMCWALYLRVSKKATIKKCARPDCGEWISLGQVGSAHKKHSNTRWCSDRCKQWNYDENKRAERATKS
jgi:hypothetical protein